MPFVTVGICRNNLWSLQFTPTFHVLFASMDGIDFSTLQSQIRSSTAQFQVGLLTIEKRGNSQVCLSFPGVCITPNKWFVCEGASPHQRYVDIAESDLYMLLEFLVHMREQF